MNSELAQFPITFLIIGITAFVSWRAMDREDLKNQLLMHPVSVVHHRQFYRLFTHAVVHRDWMHLILNLYVFYVFGESLEATFRGLAIAKGWPPFMGYVLYLALYVGAVLAASIPALVKHKDHAYYRSLGASGGVSGVVMAFVLFYPTSELLLFFIIPLPAVLAAVLFFLYEFAMAKRGGTGIAHDAHIGGAIFGGLLTIGLYPQVVPAFWNQLMSVLGIGG